jgi:hypothetical protein
LLLVAMQLPTNPDVNRVIVAARYLPTSRWACSSVLRVLGTLGRTNQQTLMMSVVCVIVTVMQCTMEVLQPCAYDDIAHESTNRVMPHRDTE